MTTNTIAPIVQYVEDGVTVTFAVPFKFLGSTELLVERIAPAGGPATALVLGVDYATAGAGDDAGGSITATVAGTAGGTLRIRRRTAREQGLDYTPNDTFPAESHELALDRLSLIVQEQDKEIERSVQVPIGELGLVMPAVDVRPDTLLGFDGAGDLYAFQVSAAALEELGAIPDQIVTVANADANMAILVANLTGPNTIGTVAGSIANVDATGAAIADVIAVSANLNGPDTIGIVAANLTGSDTVSIVAGSIDNVDATGSNIGAVVTVAGDLATDDTIGTVAGAIGNVNLTGASIGSVNTVAASIANVNTVGANLSGANTIGTVAASIANVGTVAVGIAAVGTVAANLNGPNTIFTVADAIANVDQVGNSIGNVNITAGAIGNVNTVAVAIANVNSVAGNLAGANTIGTVAASIANVDLVGPSIANVNLVGPSIANVNTVAADLVGTDTIGTVADGIADVGTVAASIASVNSVAEALASATPAVTLPAQPIVGMKIDFFGETVTWDGKWWRQQNGEYLGFFAHDFTGKAELAGKGIDTCPVDFGRIPDGERYEPGWVRVSNAAYHVYRADGLGASPVADTSSGAQSLIPGNMLTGSTEAFIAIARYVPGANSPAEPTVSLGGKTHDFACARTLASGAGQITDKKHNTSAPIIRNSEPLTGFSTANSLDLQIEVTPWLAGVEGDDANIVHLTNRDTGQRISGVTAFPGGHLLGLAARRTTTIFEQLQIIPIRRTLGKAIGDLHYLGPKTAFDQKDCDHGEARQVGDRALIPYGSSINVAPDSPSSIKLGEQLGNGRTREVVTIAQNANVSTMDVFGKIEGSCIWRPNGLTLVVTADQDPAGGPAFRVFAPSDPDDLSQPWTGGGSLSALTLPNAQGVKPVEIVAGIEDLLTANEGQATTTGPQNGAVLLHRHIAGTDPTAGAASFQSATVALAPGAISFGKRKTIVRIGTALWVYYGQRDGFRNTDGGGCIARVQVPADPFVDPWPAPEIVAGGGGTADVTQWDFGILASGDGGNSIAYVNTLSPNINFVEHPGGATSTFVIPASASAYVWYLKSAPYTRNGKSIWFYVLSEGDTGGFYGLYDATGAGDWTGELICPLNYGHAIDKYIGAWLQASGGVDGLHLPDSGGNCYQIPMFRRPDALPLPAAPAIIRSPDTHLDNLVGAMQGAGAQPGDERIKRMRTLILRGKAIGVFPDKIDFLHVLAVEAAGAALFDWLDPTRTLAPVGHTFADRFVADRGWTGSVAGVYLDPAYDPSAASRGWALNSGHLIAAVRTDTAGGNEIASVDGRTKLVVRNTSNTGWTINRATNQTVETVGAGNSLAVVPLVAGANRTAAGLSSVWVSGRKARESANPSIALSNGFRFGEASPRQASLYTGGEALTDTEMNLWKLALDSFLASIPGWKVP